MNASAWLWIIGGVLTVGSFLATPQVIKARYGDTEAFYTWLRRRTLLGMLGLALLLAGTAFAIAAA